MKQKNNPKSESGNLAPAKKDPEMTRTAFWLDKTLLTRCDLSLSLADCRS